MLHDTVTNRLVLKWVGNFRLGFLRVISFGGRVNLTPPPPSYFKNN